MSSSTAQESKWDIRVCIWPCWWFAVCSCTNLGNIPRCCFKYP